MSIGIRVDLLMQKKMIDYRFVIRKKIFPSLFYLLLMTFAWGCQEKKEVVQQGDNTPSRTTMCRFGQAAWR